MIIECLRLISPKNIFVISGATGSGKTELATALHACIPDAAWLISTTTRKPRPTDREYEYVTHEEFSRFDAEGAFFWTLPSRDDWHATRKSYVAEAIAQKRITFALLTPEMARILKSRHPRHVAAYYLHVPKHMRIARLKKRGDSLSDIQKGLKDSERWGKLAWGMQTADGYSLYDRIVRNDRSPVFAFEELYGAIMVQSGRTFNAF